MNNKTICGYPVDELIVFADACRKAEITNDQLHDFAANVKDAYMYAMRSLVVSARFPCPSEIEEMLENKSRENRRER